jgi:alpha-tubulin suppressor-like RCC1 family protein
MRAVAGAGLAVSGAISDDGRAWLWGFGTNNQLGKGDDDADEEVKHHQNSGCASLLAFLSRATSEVTLHNNGHCCTVPER